MLLQTSKLMKSLHGCDLFGKSITVNYRGSQHFNTYLSSVVSIGVVTLIAINFALLLIGFSDGSKYEAKSTSIQINGFGMKNKYYLDQNNFHVSAFYVADDIKKNSKESNSPPSRLLAHEQDDKDEEKGNQNRE